jgi:hypothetical protein
MLETSLTDDARVIIYNCHMFIAQATGVFTFWLGSMPGMLAYPRAKSFLPSLA